MRQYLSSSTHKIKGDNSLCQKLLKHLESGSELFMLQKKINQPFNDKGFENLVQDEV